MTPLRLQLMVCFTHISGWQFGVAVTRWFSINAVALHRAWLVLGWVTAFGQVNCLIT